MFMFYQFDYLSSGLDSRPEIVHPGQCRLISLVTVDALIQVEFAGPTTHLFIIFEQAYL